MITCRWNNQTTVGGNACSHNDEMDGERKVWGIYYTNPLYEGYVTSGTKMPTPFNDNRCGFLGTWK